MIIWTIPAIIARNGVRYATHTVDKVRVKCINNTKGFNRRIHKRKLMAELMIEEVDETEGKKKLHAFIEKLGAKDCKVLLNNSKCFSRLLFQPVEMLSKVTSNKKATSISPTVKACPPVDKNNINSFLSCKNRMPIKPDVFCKSSNNDFFLGEVKGTSDYTGKHPGRTYSCAHRISYEMLKNKSPVRFDAYQRYTHAFLSQPMGYLDAVIHLKNTIVIKSLRFVWLICDNSIQQNSYYADLGQQLSENVRKLFPDTPFLRFLNYEPVVDICHYYDFQINMDYLSTASEYMGKKFTEDYLL